MRTRSPAIPTEHSARRQAFERDKRLLRDEGIPVLTQRLPGHEQYGYQIDRESFYLPDLDLEPDEQVALHLAVAGVHLGDPSGRDALLKLGAAGLGDVRPIASMVPPAALIELFEAVRTHATAAFAYRAEATARGARRAVVPLRPLVPGGLGPRPDGRAHLPGGPHRRGGVRGEAGDAVVPDDVDVDVKAALPDEPWEVEGEDRVDMRVRVDALEARRVTDEVGEDKVVQPARRRVGRPGARRVVLRVHPLLGARAARPRHRHRAGRLPGGADRLARRGRGACSVLPGRGPRPGAGAAAGSRRRSRRARSAPGRETSRRLRRLLALVGWLAQVGEAPIADAAQRFGMSEKELVAELELAACCGIPPYTPGHAHGD